MHNHETFRRFVQDRVASIRHRVRVSEDYEKHREAYCAVLDGLPRQQAQILSEAVIYMQDYINSQLYSHAFKDGYEMKKVLNGDMI